MIKIKYSEILIIGSGPAGLTSSLYILRSKLNLLQISGKSVGGQLNNTNSIQNWPGLKNIKGQELINNFFSQLNYLNLEIYNDYVFSVNFLNKPFLILGKKFFYFVNFVIICTGSYYKIFNIKNNFKYIKKNISNCALCDGNFYFKKKISIIGGGDSCFENFIYLFNISNIIIIINRNKIFKASLYLIQKIFFNLKKNIFFRLNFFLIEYIGDDFLLLYIKIKNFFNFNINIIFLDGLFIFIGSSSNSIIFQGQLKIFKEFILTKKSNCYKFSKTSLNYIFSAGDVQDFLYKQIITSSSTGCVAYFDLIYSYRKLFF